MTAKYVETTAAVAVAAPAAVRMLVWAAPAYVRRIATVKTVVAMAAVEAVALARVANCVMEVRATHHVSPTATVRPVEVTVAVEAAADAPAVRYVMVGTATLRAPRIAGGLSAVQAIVPE